MCNKEKISIKCKNEKTDLENEGGPKVFPI